MNPTASPDLCCHVCGDTFLVLGDTDCARREALAAWAGCCTSPARTVRIQTPLAGAVSGKPARREVTPAADPTPCRSAGDGTLSTVARLSDLAGRLFWWLVVPGAWVTFLAALVLPRIT
jgi:hypothetical protein